MTRNRILGAAAAAAALLITAGTAFALNTSDGERAATSTEPITVAQGVTGPSGPAGPDDSPSPDDSRDDSRDAPRDAPSHQPSHEPNATATGRADGRETAIGSEDAERIALDRVGGGDVRELEREMEDGRLEWKIEIELDGMEHEIRIDAGTGEITRVEVDDD